jgi:hypothetical protein
MIDAIAMTEVIPFCLQENSGRAGHSLGAIRPFSVGEFSVRYSGSRLPRHSFRASFLPDTFDHIAGMGVPRSSLIISDEAAEL